MKATVRKPIALFLTCLTLLSSLTAPVIAHPCRDCIYLCMECIRGHCICVECCGDGGCPNPEHPNPNCYDCVACSCIHVSITSVTTLDNVNCACVGDMVTFIAHLYPIHTHKGNLVQWSAPGAYYPTGTGPMFTTLWLTPGEKTVTASLCGSSKEKQVDICDPNTESCCNGSCCDKVWTKHTTEPITTNCPSCGNGPAGEGLCGGTTTELESYEECLNVGVGQGEHCQCYSSYQRVGYTYPCMINWNVAKMTWCALKGGWCIIVCIETMNPASCANCLCTTSQDCCTNPECEVCDFVEKCEKNPYYREEQKSLVFTGFGC